MTSLETHELQLLDQSWMKAEQWTDVFLRMSNEDPSSILEDPETRYYYEMLYRKACAIVAAQCFANIRERNATEADQPT